MKELLRCMDTIPQGVFIVGTKLGEAYNFMTAAFVTQVSFNPCSIALSVAKPHYTAELIQTEGKFAISVLASDQQAEAKACGYQSGRKTDKSARVRYHLTPEGLPVIDGAASHMVCRVRQTVDYEDHVVFLAEIESGEYTEKPPMIYASKDFFPGG